MYGQYFVRISLVFIPQENPGAMVRDLFVSYSFRTAETLVKIPAVLEARTRITVGHGLLGALY